MGPLQKALLVYLLVCLLSLSVMILTIRSDNKKFKDFDDDV